MKELSLKKRSVFALILLFSFCIVFGIASIVAYDSYTKAVEVSFRSNETRAYLLAKLIQECQRAAIGGPSIILQPTSNSDAYIIVINQEGHIIFSNRFLYSAGVSEEMPLGRGNRS